MQLQPTASCMASWIAGGRGPAPHDGRQLPCTGAGGDRASRERAGDRVSTDASTRDADALTHLALREPRRHVTGPGSALPPGSGHQYPLDGRATHGEAIAIEAEIVELGLRARVRLPVPSHRQRRPSPAPDRTLERSWINGLNRRRRSASSNGPSEALNLCLRVVEGTRNGPQASLTTPRRCPHPSRRSSSLLFLAPLCVRHNAPRNGGRRPFTSSKPGEVGRGGL